jgi:hypothetical protein
MHLLGDTTDDVAGVGMADEDDALEVFPLDQVDDVGDMCREIYLCVEQV